MCRLLNCRSTLPAVLTTILVLVMALVLAMAGATLGLSPLQAKDGGRSDASGDGRSQVDQLIQRLGSDSYATRFRARERLQRLGLEAFDQLHTAQFHSDSEIAMAARHLLSSLMVSWSKESDPPEVREALHEYGAQLENERSSRIEMLAGLPDRQGLIALARLVRFETSLRLSRRAAIVLMQQSMNDDPVVRQLRSGQLNETLGSNDRLASQWLRVYAKDLSSGDYSTEQWRGLIDRQRQEIDAAATQQSTRPSVLELVRVCATRAAQSGQESEALSLAAANIDLIPPTTRDMVDACNWAIDNRLHPFVLELRRQHRRMFDTQPILLYGAAEATKVAGDSTQANQLAERALRIKPIPKNADERDKMSPKEMDESAQAHRAIGYTLEERGLFRWAELEFRLVIDAIEIDSVTAAGTRVQLARMLGELERHKEVVDLLEPLTNRVEKDDKFKQRLMSIGFSYPAAKSNQQYHGALAKIKGGDVEEAKPMLRRAYMMYPMNIDILITMYRLKSDDQWNSQTLDTLQKTIRTVSFNVRSAEMKVRHAGKSRGKSRQLVEDLGQELNQYAWLVSNTEGDYQRALEWSLRSLELDSDSAKLDTCARCYYAVGDLDNAIRTQRHALRLTPHSPPMVRQLAMFEAELAQRHDRTGDGEKEADAEKLEQP